MSAAQQQAAGKQDWQKGLVPVGPHAAGRPGPFYCYNPGAPKYQLYGSDICVDSIGNGVLQEIFTRKKLYDLDVANGHGEGIFKRANNGTTEFVTPVSIPAWDNMRYLMESYGEEGFIFINPFEGYDEKIVKPRLFTELLRPASIWPQDIELMDNRDEAEALARRIDAEGANVLIKEMAQEALTAVKSEEFKRRYGAELVGLYSQAIPIVITSINNFDRFAKRYLNRQDGLIRKSQNGGRGKPEYDGRDFFYQYMTGRKPVDDAVTRALSGQQGGGLTADQLKTVLTSVTQTTAQKPAPAIPQIQCTNCGNFANLLADGSPPKKCIAVGCGEPFEVPSKDGKKKNGS